MTSFHLKLPPINTASNIYIYNVYSRFYVFDIDIIYVVRRDKGASAQAHGGVVIEIPLASKGKSTDFFVSTATASHDWLKIPFVV